MDKKIKIFGGGDDLEMFAKDSKSAGLEIQKTTLWISSGGGGPRIPVLWITGAITALAPIVIAWVKSRKAKIKIKHDKTTIEIEANSAEEVAKILQECKAPEIYIGDEVIEVLSSDSSGHWSGMERGLAKQEQKPKRKRPQRRRTRNTGK